MGDTQLEQSLPWLLGWMLLSWTATYDGFIPEFLISPNLLTLQLVRKSYGELAEKYLPKGRAGDYNQALMDLGASICLPQNPTCPLCPLRSLCKAQALGFQELRPVMKPKLKVPHYIVTAAVIRRKNKILLAKRPSKGLLGGMWEFPGGKVEKGESLDVCLVREIREELGAGIRVGEAFGIYKHAYTHFRITLYAFECEVTDGKPHPVESARLVWVLPADMNEYPMGKVDRQIARRLQGTK